MVEGVLDLVLDVVEGGGEGSFRVPRTPDAGDVLVEGVVHLPTPILVPPGTDGRGGDGDREDSHDSDRYHLQFLRLVQTFHLETSDRLLSETL